MSWWSSWRLALRLARRDLLKHKARAIIALVMVTLPVFGVITADILIQTNDVSMVEGVDRQLGTAATASVAISGDGSSSSAKPILGRPTTEADIRKAIGDRTMLPYETSQALVETSEGRSLATTRGLDGSAPLAKGLLNLVAGRWPTTQDEVVVNQGLRDRGIGDRITIATRDGRGLTVRVVGTIRDATYRTEPVIVGQPGWLPREAQPGYGESSWLVDGPRLTDADLEALGAIGAYAMDRYRSLHPEQFEGDDGFAGDDGTAQVAALVIVMALIEVVLLAGPAFAVGARKQQRSLALMASSGGTPRQSRRVIVAGGWILGLTAGVVGVVGGIGAGWALLPVVQRFSSMWMGPFEIVWWHLAAVVVFGLVSALTACVVPAWIASRQNVVAVLAGRRGDAKPVRAFPWIGLGLFGVGVLVAIAGTREIGGELTIAWAAVICVLGMVFLVPTVVSWVARLAGRFPLAMRFAARDAVRHRTRTTPAVAAVAATVAGIVALGIGTASDELENRETYQPGLVMGDAAVTARNDNAFGEPSGQSTDWAAAKAAVLAQAPDAKVRAVTGVQSDFATDTWTEVNVLEPGSKPRDWAWIGPDNMSGSLGSSILVSNGSDLPGIVTKAAPGAAAALAAGKAVVFAGEEAQQDLTSVIISTRAYVNGTSEGKPTRTTVPATVVVTREAAPQMVLPPALAKKAGLTATTVGLDVSHPGLSEDQEKSLDAQLRALPTPAGISVERGYQASDDVLILQGLLFLLAAVLMLGGTLTAMFLALSDARPDLATLSAVGAEARVRRKVAASYTFVVAFVGAVLGLCVGLVPGIAVTRPLTEHNYLDAGPFLDIPWLLILAVVIGLPVLTAVIVGACVRATLPMVSRLT